MKISLLIAAFLIAATFGGVLSKGGDKVDYKTFPDPNEDLKLAPDSGPQTMVVAGGCFWCTEGVCELAPGVVDVVSGYAGGSAKDANYEAVSTGTTGHAEAIKITYDPTKTSYGRLLKLFFSVGHDPTQLNRQGPDKGTQYRSAIFYENEDQRRVAANYIKQLDEAKVFAEPIVTKLEKLERFYPAEEYHQDFVKRNPNHPYIQQQAMPKVEKARKAAASQPS